MALLSCPECGQTVSDRAVSCPHCGSPLKATDDVVDIIDTADMPQVSGVVKTKRMKMIVAAGVLVAVVVCIAVGLYMKNVAARSAYQKNLSLAVSDMLSGAASSETAGNKIKSVWYNTIYEEFDAETDKYTRANGGKGGHFEDFNESLGVLFADAEFKQNINSIKSNQSDVKELMKSLTNPPDEYVEAYSALKEYYDAYLELTNLVCSPSGNLQTFSESFSAADGAVLKHLEKMKVYTE